MLPIHRTQAILLEDRLVCLVLKELSLGRFLSRAQRVERYYISINPFTDGYERRNLSSHRSWLAGANNGVERNTLPLFILTQLYTSVKSSLQFDFFVASSLRMTSFFSSSINTLLSSIFLKRSSSF